MNTAGLTGKAWRCAAILSLGFAVAAPAQEISNMTGSKAHPCVLIHAETLSSLRAKGTAVEPTEFGFSTASVWAQIRAKADRFVQAAPYHYSVSIPGEGGVVLEEWSYTLSDQTPPLHEKSPNYPPWTAMFQERPDSITTRLVHLSFAYIMTGEERYAARAKKIALHLTQWTQWTDPSYGAGRIEACLDTGHCMYAMGLFYDWCFDRLSPAERDQVRDAIIHKGIVPSLGYVDHYPADTNGYAVITTGAGLAALAVRPEVPRAGEWLQQAIDKTRVSLDRGGRDGGMFEGPMYGTYLIDSFALFFDALISARVEQDLLDHSYLTTMDRYCIGLLAPDTRQIPCFSDGSPAQAVPKLMSIRAQRGSTDAAWYLQQIGAVKPKDIYDFIRFDADAFNPRQPEWNPSSVFYDIGYASLRDRFNPNAPSLFFKSGPKDNRIGHNHFDHNAFVISYGGQWIIPDRGYRNFYIPAKRKFSVGSIGHCTLVLNVDDAYFQDHSVPSIGHDQIHKAGGVMTDFFPGNRHDLVTGEAAATYNSEDRRVLDTFERTIVFIKPHVFVMRDRLAAPAPTRFNLLIHSDGNGEITREGENILVTRGTAQVLTRMLSNTPLTPHIEMYPGAETYGQYLRMETAETRDTNVLTVMYPRPFQADNLLRNGSFEKQMAGWTPRSNQDLPNHKIVTESPADGQRCARIDTSGYYYSDKFGLPAGTAITARASIRTTAMPEGKGATMTLHFWRGGKSFANRRIGPFADTDWTEHELIATVPPGTDQVSLALEFFAPGTAWFDRASLQTDIEVAEPLTPTVRHMADNAAAIELGAERFLVSFGEAGARRTAGPLASDSELAVVTLDADGAASRVFVHKGTFVSFDGARLLELPEPGSAEKDL